MTCIAGDLRFSFTWWNLLQADNARVFGSRKSFLLAIPKVFLVIKVRFRELMRCGYVGIMRTCFDCKPAMRWRVTLLYFSVEQLIRRIMASCLSLRATSSIIASGRSCERTRFTQIKSLLFIFSVLDQAPGQTLGLWRKWRTGHQRSRVF